VWNSQRGFSPASCLLLLSYEEQWKRKGAGSAAAAGVLEWAGEQAAAERAATQHFVGMTHKRSCLIGQLEEVGLQQSKWWVCSSNRST
jgi:hypothetical protein